MESVEDVDEFLLKIERKYSCISDCSLNSDLEKELHILSEEFETMGLPAIDLKQPETKLLQQIASNALLLVQIHRKTLSHVTNLDIDGRFKDTKNEDLKKTILELKKKNMLVENQNRKLERDVTKLIDECNQLKTIVANHSQETDKIKHYHKSKQNELVHLLNNLKNENQRLKEMFGKDIDKYYSKDDKFLKVIKKYKQNEEIQKSAIKKLEENNTEIMNEILNLRSELALAYLKKE